MVTAPRHTFTKAERLTSKKLMDELFKRGSSIYFEPIRMVWLPAPEGALSVAQVVFPVPKKSFASAVHRNRIRRLVREAYRLHKQEFYATLQEANRAVLVAFIYTGKEIPDFKAVEAKMVAALGRLAREAVKKL